jgi:hypothetical protein
MVEKGFSSATLKDDDSVSWEVSIEWTPLARTSLTLMTAKAPEETDGSGSYIYRTSASLVWSHGWTERFNSRLSAGRRTGNYVNNSRDDDEDNIGIGFTYSMRRWLDLSVDWNYSDRSSSQTGLDYDKNVVYLRADISL